MFNDLIPAQQTVPLADRGAHPVAVDYHTSTGGLDPAAFASALHNWMYTAHADPSTVSGYTAPPTPASGGTPAPTGTPTPPGTTPTPAPGTAPGTPASALSAWNTFYNSPAYQVPLAEGEKAVNTKYAAMGALESGAAMKGIESFAAGHASGALNTYLDDLYRQEALGEAASSSLAGVGQNLVSQVSANNNNAANAAGNAALVGGKAIANNWNNIGGAIGTAAGTIAGAFPSSFASNNALSPTNIAGGSDWLYQ